MQDIVSKVHVHMPYHLLPKYLEMILQQKLNLEIYFSHYSLQILDKTKCMETAKLLADAGLKITFHAPFMDLRPGAMDDKIRQTSVDRIKQIFDLAPYFHPLKIVCHASFDERYYVFGDDLWLEASIKTWKELIVLAKENKTIIALENIYETAPEPLHRLLTALASPHICFCFDTGHFNAFARAPLELWLDQMGPFIGQLHVHDNHGVTDEHLPVGEGNFPFPAFLKKIRELGRHPIVTIEAHSEANLWRTLENIKAMKLFAEL